MIYILTKKMTRKKKSSFFVWICLIFEDCLWRTKRYMLVLNIEQMAFVYQQQKIENFNWFNFVSTKTWNCIWVFVTASLVRYIYHGCLFFSLIFLFYHRFFLSLMFSRNWQFLLKIETRKIHHQQYVWYKYVRRTKINLVGERGRFQTSFLEKYYCKKTLSSNTVYVAFIRWE